MNREERRRLQRLSLIHILLKVFWWTTLVAVIALAAALAAVFAGLWPIGPWLGCTAVVAEMCIRDSHMTGAVDADWTVTVA